MVASQTRVQTLEVTCITMSLGSYSHQAIAQLGGPNWRMTRAQVVNAILNLGWTFYTDDHRGHVAILRVVKEPNGSFYVQTWADGVWTNNLLSLPRCL